MRIACPLADRVSLPAASAGATLPPNRVVIPTTQILILDYVTGNFLEAQFWPGI